MKVRRRYWQTVVKVCGRRGGGKLCASRTGCLLAGSGRVGGRRDIQQLGADRSVVAGDDGECDLTD